MAKGFGIAALVFAILAIFIPFGFVVSGIAVLLAYVAALAGDRGFTIATTVIAVVNTVFLSPSTWIMLGGNDPGAQRFMTVIIIAGIALPIISIVLNATGKVVLKG